MERVVATAAVAVAAAAITGAMLSWYRRRSAELMVASAEREVQKMKQLMAQLRDELERANAAAACAARGAEVQEMKLQMAQLREELERANAAAECAAQEAEVQAIARAEVHAARAARRQQFEIARSASQAERAKRQDHLKDLEAELALLRQQKATTSTIDHIEAHYKRATPHSDTKGTSDASDLARRREAAANESARRRARIAERRKASAQLHELLDRESPR